MTDTEILKLAKRFHAGKRGGGYIVPISKIADALDAPYTAVMRKAAELGAEKQPLGDYLFPAELLDSVSEDSEIPDTRPKTADSRENGSHKLPTSDSTDFALEKDTTLPQEEHAAKNTINTNIIPAELKTRRQWVMWRRETRDGKPTKIPYQINGRKAQSNNPATWTTFENALRHISRFDGIGYVFSENDPYCGIDVDNCLNPDGTIKTWAIPIIDKLRLIAYLEVSPSGTGMKAWTRSKLPGGGRNTQIGDGKIEVYDQGRYFTMTGHNGKGAITHGEDAVDWLLDQYFKSIQETQPAKPVKRTSAPQTKNVVELIGKIETSRQAAKFRDLMHGKWQLYPEYGSHSEGDLGLCGVIAFWKQDYGTIDAIFRQSQLWRQKWDDKHSRDGRTYGQLTIDKALSSPRDTYTPQQRPTRYTQPNRYGGYRNARGRYTRR